MDLLFPGWGVCYSVAWAYHLISPIGIFPEWLPTLWYVKSFNMVDIIHADINNVYEIKYVDGRRQYSSDGDGTIVMTEYIFV